MQVYTYTCIYIINTPIDTLVFCIHRADRIADLSVYLNCCQFGLVASQTPAALFDCSVQIGQLGKLLNNFIGRISAYNTSTL